MKQTTLHPDAKRLGQFLSLKDLSNEQLDLLARSQFIQQAHQGEKLLERGDRTPGSFLLLSGEVELVAQDGVRKLIKAGSESARAPLAQLLPRRYTVTACCLIEFLRLDFQLLECLRESSELSRRDSSMVVEHDSDSLSANSGFGQQEEGMLIDRLRTDLTTDRFILPSLPDIAMRIGRAINDDSSDAERITRIIQTDPAIAAKIMRAANSAMYTVQNPVNTCSAAVMRLGFNTTQKLVLTFALREIFQTRDPKLQKRVQALWSHSTHIAALSYVLARVIRQFNPEHAMLAGLLHDIGEMAILSYVDRLSTLNLDAKDVDAAVTRLRADAGGMILQRWEFPDDFVSTAQGAEDWHRNPHPKADYCDLVIVAQLHSYVGTDRMRDLPNMGQLPCFAKLGLDELTPKQSLKILNSAQRQIDEAQSLLNL